MTTIDAETFKRAMCRVFDLPWDARNNDYDQTDPLSVSFIEEGFMRAEILYELTESDIAICKSTHRWSQVTTTRFLKLLGWLHESRRTTGHWNDLLKETITSRVLTPSAGSPTAAGNRSFGDFSAA
jgi:hypothetical protein